MKKGLHVANLNVRHLLSKLDDVSMVLASENGPDILGLCEKVQVGKDQEKAQSEKDSHSTNRGGKKPNQQSGTYTMKQS